MKWERMEDVKKVVEEEEGKVINNELLWYNKKK